MYFLCWLISRILTEKVLHRALLLKRGVMRVEVMSESEIQDMYQDAISDFEFGC